MARVTPWLVVPTEKEMGRCVKFGNIPQFSVLSLLQISSIRILPLVDFVGWCNLLVGPRPKPALHTDWLQVWTVTPVKITKPGIWDQVFV